MYASECHFICQNPEVIVGILFTASQLIVRNPENLQMDLVLVEESEGGAFPDHGLSSRRQRSLRYGKQEFYRLLPEFKAQVLAEMGVLVCTVDLYANPINNTEALCCASLNSWFCLGHCWANPPWCHILKMLTKAVLDGAKLAVITPESGQTGEAAKWRPLLDRLT